MTQIILPAGVEPVSATQLPAALVGGRLSVDASGVAVPVTDNAGSLTVDAPVATPVAARLSDGAAFLTTTTGRLAVDGSGVTQPVSGTVTADTELPAAAALSDSLANPTTPQVGANCLLWDATNTVWRRAQATAGTGKLLVDGSTVTQPVSGTVTANQGTAAAASGAWPAKVTDGTNVSAVKAASTAVAATDPSLAVGLSPNSPLPAGTNSIGGVTAPTLTKATQGANGWSTQDLKDAGRVAITITGYQVAGIITTEALFAASLVRAADGVTAAAAAQFTVTAGKRLRLQQLIVTVKNTAAAAGTSKLALRYRPGGGTVAITDSIVAVLDIGSNNAVAANYIGPYAINLPDGFEMVGSATYGFTSLCSAVTMLHTITLIGFEY